MALEVIDLTYGIKLTGRFGIFLGIVVLPGFKVPYLAQLNNFVLNLWMLYQYGIDS